MIRHRRRIAPPYKLLSVLLRYPDERVVEAREEIAAAVAALPASRQRDSLQRFVSDFTTTPAGALAERYVETFDLRRRSGL
jgi:nitrate reductase delta subunit